MSDFHCRECRSPATSFAPACIACGARNSLVSGPAPTAREGWVAEKPRARLMKDVPKDAFTRFPTGTRELDRVLGGGAVSGGIVLFYADPGFGKSTLLLQVCADLSNATVEIERTTPDGRKEQRDPFVTILYAAAEETEGQIKDRCERVSPDGTGRLYIFNNADLDEIEREILRIKPDVLVVDSVQTIVKRSIDGEAGSIAQVKGCATHLTALSKAMGISTFLVAHVNKDGVVAGPKTLEHLVDTELEGVTDRSGLRIIRTPKNRYGDASEMAIFRMTADGLKSIDNAIELFMPAHEDDVPGTCLGLSMLGSRPICVEVQSLLTGFDPARKGRQVHARGIAERQIVHVVAVLEARCGAGFGGRDTHASVAGGVEMRDGGLDLPLVFSLGSSLLGEAIPRSMAAFGEIGLAGEVRKPDNWEARLKQARIMGIETIVGPSIDEENSKDDYVGCATVREALSVLGWELGFVERKKATRKRGRK